MTKVVNIKHESYDVYIGRSSAYGNPFVIGLHGTRNEVLEKYSNYLMKRPELVEKAKRELKGKRLGCHCAPLACHGDILKELIGE